MAKRPKTRRVRGVTDRNNMRVVSHKCTHDLCQRVKNVATTLILQNSKLGFTTAEARKAISWLPYCSVHRVTFLQRG